jgi:hypothetical protein
MMPSLATLKLIGYGLGALAIVALFTMVMGWETERDHLRTQVAATCAVTREAAANPKMDCKNVDAQIREIGLSVVNLKIAIIEQNDAVRRMSDASAKAQDEAVKAISSAKERVKAADATADRLRASASDNQRKKAPCEPSDELKGAWK